MFTLILSVTIRRWNQVLWLDVPSHVTSLNQSEYIILAPGSCTYWQLYVKYFQLKWKKNLKLLLKWFHLELLFDKIYEGTFTVIWKINGFIMTLSGGPERRQNEPLHSSN